jgi:hypothetical protein
MLAIMIGVPVGLLIAFLHSKILYSDRISRWEEASHANLDRRGVTVKVYDEELKNRCLNLGARIAANREEMFFSKLSPIPIETPHEPLTRNARIEGYAPTDYDDTLSQREEV